MTRRDLQGEMKKQGRPWCIGKAFDQSAPIGPITPVAQAGDVDNAEIWVQVNGKDRQRSNVSKLIWNIAETIEHLSAAWELQPGDLIYTGTPEGVAAVVSGDTMVGGVAGLGTLTRQGRVSSRIAASLRLSRRRGQHEQGKRPPCAAVFLKGRFAR
jgi:fumarylpyruvate hydrolase